MCPQAGDSGRGLAYGGQGSAATMAWGGGSATTEGHEPLTWPRVYFCCFFFRVIILATYWFLACHGAWAGTVHPSEHL